MGKPVRIQELIVTDRENGMTYEEIKKKYSISIERASQYWIAKY